MGGVGGSKEEGAMGGLCLYTFRVFCIGVQKNVYGTFLHRPTLLVLFNAPPSPPRQAHLHLPSDREVPNPMTAGCMIESSNFGIQSRMSVGGVRPVQCWEGTRR